LDQGRLRTLPGTPKGKSGQKKSWGEEREFDKKKRRTRTSETRGREAGTKEKAVCKQRRKKKLRKKKPTEKKRLANQFHQGQIGPGKEGTR